MGIGPGKDFATLCALASKRGIEVTLPQYRSAGRVYLRIEAKKGDKVIDYEDVKVKESVENAAGRMLRRMTKDRVV